MFAAKDLYQSDDLMELVGIVAITGTGGSGFCWFFMKWRYNIWAIFGLHSLMNLWWEVFAVDDTALGGWLANGARLATVVIAVLLTIYTAFDAGGNIEVAVAAVGRGQKSRPRPA